MTKITVLASFVAMAVSFWLLLGISYCLEGRVNRLRLGLGALLVGIHTWVCLGYGRNFPGNEWIHASVLVLSGVAVLGWSVKGVKMAVLYALILRCLEAVAASSDRQGWLWLTALAGLIGLLFYGNRGQRNAQRQYIPVAVYHRGQVFRFTALRDNGNLLTDPFTGEAVLILGGKQAQQLSGLTSEQLADPFQTMLERPVKGLRLIPYRSLGNPCGFLLGMRFQKVEIDGHFRSAMIALTGDSLGMGAGFQALVGGAA